ncbi:MAG: glycosyltransferase family 2 protein [Hyphomicrobiaceae bacterium]|nr:glycosyltransferase family 2 protein [Hyphomicrobiaceae bacterium]
MRSSHPQIAVTVIIPTRNEAPHIPTTLQSILTSKDVLGEIEVIVADGNSTDNTRALVEELAERDPRIRLLPNPGGFAAHAFNLGIKAGRGRYLMIMSAHARLMPNHLADCIAALEAGRADIVGGIIETVPSGQSDEALVVWCVMNSALGFGPSKFRTGLQAPAFVDTIGAGMMRRDVIDAIGLFDEELIRGQDDEFNARARAANKRLLLLPHLRLTYTSRSTKQQLYNMCFQYGAYKPISNLKAGSLISLRQFAPSAMLSIWCLALLGALREPGLVIVPVGILAGYFGLAAAASLRVGRLSPSFLTQAFAAFVAAHVGYGLGFLRGVWAVMRFGRGAARALATAQQLTAITR